MLDDIITYFLHSFPSSQHKDNSTWLFFEICVDFITFLEKNVGQHRVITLIIGGNSISTQIRLTPIATILFVDEAIRPELGLIWEDDIWMNVNLEFFGERESKRADCINFGHCSDILENLFFFNFRSIYSFQAQRYTVVRNTLFLEFDVNNSHIGRYKVNWKFEELTRFNHF